MCEPVFLSGTAASRAAYLTAITQAVATLLVALPGLPDGDASPAALATRLSDDLCPVQGQSLATVFEHLATVVQHSIHVAHPHVAGRLHYPPFIPALAAEVVLSALHQSMDSCAQAPVATGVEQRLLHWLCQEVGLPASAAGTVTADGSHANSMGLWLARDAALKQHWQWSARQHGLPPQAARLRILCSEVAHVTVEHSAAQLGLGTEAVVKVPVTEDGRISIPHLRATLERLRCDRLVPMALVGMAGTTDFGSIDPLEEMAALAWSSGAWFHVDAASGGALLFSPRHRHALRGLALAHSMTLDFPQLFWQPMSGGALLVRDAAGCDLLPRRADSLHPAVPQALGIPDLVTHSVLTRRRFDALKLWVSLQTLGRSRLATMIDTTLDLAQHAATVIAAEPRLALLHWPTLGCVVVRYQPHDPTAPDEAIHDGIRRHLLATGQAVVGQTTVQGRTCLKLTLLNPTVRRDDVTDLIAAIVHEGKRLEDIYRSAAEHVAVSAGHTRLRRRQEALL